MIEQINAEQTYIQENHLVTLNVNEKKIRVYYSYTSDSEGYLDNDYEINEEDKKLLTEEEQEEVTDFIMDNQVDLGVGK